MLNPKAPSLRELQTWMRWIVTDPRGVNEALRDSTPKEKTRNLIRYTEPDVSALSFISGSTLVDVTTRLDIYAEAYFSRIVEAMTADFSLTKLFLGESLFQKLIADYLKEFPSQSPNIGDVGQHLAYFVSCYSLQKDFPYLYELVLLDWLQIESFYSPEAPSLSPEALASLNESDWEKVGFEINPSLRFLQSVWPLEKLWTLRELSDLPEEAHNLTPGKSLYFYCVSRTQGHIELSRLEPAERDLLKLLEEGYDLNQSLEQVALLYPSQNINETVGRYFARWLPNGFIQEIRL